MKRAKNRYRAMISADWNECLAPCGPFDAIAFAYPGLQSELTAVFRRRFSGADPVPGEEPALLKKEKGETMLPEIKKILYPTDLSENAKHAFGYAASLAQRYGATITILHVVEELSQNTALLLSSMLGEERWRQIKKETSEDFTEMIRERIDRFCREMDRENTECSFAVDRISVRKGRAVQIITREAEEGGYDLVVMGTHGQGGFTDAMMGSTARRVTRRSKVPVMVVRLPE